MSRCWSRIAAAVPRGSRRRTESYKVEVCGRREALVSGLEDRSTVHGENREQNKEDNCLKEEKRGRVVKRRKEGRRTRISPHIPTIAGKDDTSYYN